MTYEELQNRHTNLNIVELSLSGVSSLKGLYIDGDIAIEKSLSDIEKSCVLAEELGHHFTTSGNILDQSNVSNRKQEYRARLYGYNLQIGLIGLVRAFEHGCQNIHEAAEYLEVTEEYLLEAIQCYHQKYGLCATVDNYIVYFEPCLGVVKMN